MIHCKSPAPFPVSAATHANFPFPAPDGPSSPAVRTLPGGEHAPGSECCGCDLPPGVAEFIDRSITTIEQLDILQLLAAEPGTAWTAPGVYRRILTSVSSIEQHLRHFKALGLAGEERGSPPAYRITAEEPARDRIRLALACYRDMPVRVIRHIYERRPSEAQGFADAFILKRQGS